MVDPWSRIESFTTVVALIRILNYLIHWELRDCHQLLAPQKLIMDRIEDHQITDQKCTQPYIFKIDETDHGFHFADPRFKFYFAPIKRYWDFNYEYNNYSSIYSKKQSRKNDPCLYLITIRIYVKIIEKKSHTQSLHLFSSFNITIWYIYGTPHSSTRKTF